MAETTQPDPAEIPFTTDAPIDIVRLTSDNINVLSNDSEHSQDGKQASQKRSPATPKKKHLENVWISQAAYGELQSFGIRAAPSIGLIHGTMSSQGIALINRFSVIPRDLRSLCRWKVSAAGGSFHNDAIGFIVLYYTIIFVVVALSFVCILVGRENLLGIQVQRFRNEAGHLVIKSNGALYSADLSTKLRPVPIFGLASCGPLYQLGDAASSVELVEVRKMLSSAVSRLQCKLFEDQSRDHSQVAKELFDLNNASQLDRVLLELRNNINQRVLELERASVSKKQKTSNREAETTGREDVAKFRNHIIQLALKEFTQTNEVLSKRPIPSAGSDYTPTIFTKSAKNSFSKTGAASVAKRKAPKPATKPAPSTT